MREAASMLAAYFAFACAHGAANGRVPGLRELRERPTAKALLRLLAVAAFLSSLALWPRADGWPAPVLGASLSLLGSASLMIVLAPIFPRLAWGMAMASPAVIAALALGSNLGR